MTGRTTNDPKADEVLMGMHALAAALKVIKMIQRMKKKWRNRTRMWTVAHAAVPLSQILACTGGFTYAVGVWDSSIAQGPFSVAPCQTLS